MTHKPTRMRNFFAHLWLSLPLWGMVTAGHAQLGCPGCVITLPDSLSTDTIYISTAPDGEAGQYYEADLSFRLPITTTPVAATDSTVLPGLNINQISIQAVVNLPPGLNWQASQMTFDVSQGETDGCAKLCGTPLQPGLYLVSVVVVAQVAIVTQSSSFTFPIYIAPATVQTEGFTMVNASGCGQTTVTFSNNIPANGQSGISWWWDFGNGHTSTDEHPPPQIYDTAGIYPVHYEALIDTVGFILSALTIDEVGCTDVSIPPIFNGAPDLFVRLYGPNGELVYESEAVQNANPPIAFSPQLLLDPGVYTLEVRDQELIGSESCGQILFTRDSNGLMIHDALQVSLHIVHPVQHIQSADTVVVYPLPARPQLQVEAPGWLCTGSTLQLWSQYGQQIQWYRDSNLLVGQTDSLLTINQGGYYWQQYTSPDGCQVRSDTVQIEEVSPPPLPLFYNEHNLLRMYYPTALSNYALQWFLNDQPIGTPGDTVLCATEFGTYTLMATDTSTGCYSTFALTVVIDPNYSCLTHTDELRLSANIVLYPNPTTQTLWIEWPTTPPSPTTISIYSPDGKEVWQLLWPQGQKKFALELNQLSTGLWIIQFTNKHMTANAQFIKK